MATIDADNLEFCVDCCMAIANGEATDAHMGDMIKLWGEGINGVLGLVLSCPENCEGWFSWSDCDGCGSSLGGDRHPGAHIIP